MKNSKQIWIGIKEIISLKTENKANKLSLDFGGYFISDQKVIAESLNNYFTQIADNIKSKLPPTNKSYRDFMGNPCRQSFFINPTSTDEVMKIIGSIDHSKATGPYSIPKQILSSIPLEISTILVEIFNLSFQTGKFINALKQVKVVPVFKNKGSPYETGNYRPISLLSNVDKIMEKLVHKRMVNFLENNKLLYNRQFGFRSKHSTVHGLTTITEDLKKSIDEGKLTCGVFIDLQKAFDTVDLDILLKKLKLYGFRGLTNDWFSSYLLGRKQFVSLSGENSSYKNIRHGVPQGSVLGPILFLIYINDLARAIIYSKLYNFADDTAILYSDHSPKRLKKRINIDLKLLLQWLKANRIQLNVAKTEVVLFKNKSKRVDYNIKIKLDGKLIRFSKCTKYLGLLIDENLSFYNHKENIINKLRKANSALCMIRHYVPFTILRSIYFSLFQPHIHYGLQIWGQNLCPRSRINRLQRIAVRLITFSVFNAPSKPLFMLAKIPTVSDYVFKLNILLAHDILNLASPVAVQQVLNIQYLPDKYLTRGKGIKLLKRPYVRTTKYGINSMRYQIVLNWNSLQKLFNDIDLASLRRIRINKLL